MFCGKCSNKLVDIGGEDQKEWEGEGQYKKQGR
jgi:hypothetical protein